MSSRRPASTHLAEVAWVFLRLGTIAFGGPAAHVAMMEEEVVRRRRWLPRERFLDLVGATNLIPGPNSTELAIHLGHLRAGWAGLVVAGVCFIVPAMLIVGTIAWLYVRFGALPQADALLYGVKPVVIAIVLQAIVGLTRTAVRTFDLALLGILALALVLLGVHELVVLLAVGVLASIVAGARTLGRPRDAAAVLAPVAVPGGGSIATAAPVATAGATAAAIGLGPLFLFFLKVGSVLFGSGYVLLAFLRADLVLRWHWLTERQLLDAIAVGQMTPGPVFTTATFIGYVLSGTRGALVATAGIFLPAFVFVAMSGPLIPRLRRSPALGALLDGVNVASLALMAVVAVELARSAVADVQTLALAAASAFLLVRYKMNSAWLVLAGGLIGLALH